MKLLYRELKVEDIDKLDQIDLSQKLGQKYIYRAGQLEVLDCQEEIPNWTEDDISFYKTRLKEIKEAGGFLYGAFSRASCLMGLVALDKTRLNEGQDFIDLDMILVSRSHRKMGIGHSLMMKAIKEARLSGASYIKIVSSNSKETIDFYRAQGAELLEPLDGRGTGDKLDLRLDLP